MTTALPAEFQLLRDGYSANLSYPVLEIQIDRGTTRKRHDPLYVPHVLNVSWSLDDGQYTRLMGFFRNDLDFGTLPFLMDAVTDLHTPTTHKCRCVGGLPKLVQQSGLNYKVQCTIEAFANPTYTGLLEYQAPNEILFAPTYPPFPGAFRFGDSVRVVGAAGTHPDGDVSIDLDGEYTIGDGSTTSVDWVFDGVNDEVDFGDVLDMARTTPRSIFAWYSTTTAGRVAIGKQSAANQVGWRFACPSTLADQDFIICGPSGTQQIQVGATTRPPTDGALHHFGFTYTGSSTAAGFKFYTDTVESTVTVDLDNLTSATTTNAEPLQIGNRGSSAAYDGILTHISVWDRVLTAAEVIEIFGGGSPPDLSALSFFSDCILWIKLDATDAVGAGGIVDHSASGTDGTATFSPTLSASDPGLEAGAMRLVNPHLVNADWTTLAGLTPDSFGPVDVGNKVSSVTRVPT